MTQKKIVAIIPARYASTRFPAKPLALIDGKPMIKHVWERAVEVFGVGMVYVATDNQEIFDTVDGFGGSAIMTSAELPSGTDRVAVAASLLPFVPDVVVNIQGDEPFIAVEQLRQIIQLFDDQNCDIATLIHPISDPAELHNPNCVKAVVSEEGQYALYFSRQPIPYLRGVAPEDWTQTHQYYKHIGLYGYRQQVLEQLTKMPVAELEKAESLEQLRWLANGLRIKTATTTIPSYGIDTPEDLEKITELKKSGKIFAK